MDPLRPVLLIMALTVTLGIALVPAHIGLSLPTLVLETNDDWAPEWGFDRSIYLLLDGYYILFVLFSITPFLTLLLWSIHSKLKRQFPKKGRVGMNGKGTSDLFRDTNSPPVTVIIPCHNEAPHIGAAVMGAVRQTYKGEIEVLVIDDGSSDLTWSIGRALRVDLQHRTVKVIHKKKGGKASALTTGIRASTGRIIITTDGDSQLEKEAVREIVGTFRENADAGIVGGYVSIKNTHVNILTKLQEFEYLITQDMIRMNQSDDGNVQIAPGPIFGIRADLARLFHPLDRTVVEDCDLTQSILSSRMTTRSNDGAMSFTQAPESINAWARQRRRWIYGQFQSWRENRWHLLRNPWAVYTYFTWAFNAVSAFIFVLFMGTSIIMVLRGSDLYTLMGFITLRSLVVLILYFGTRGSILLLHRETRGHILYLPLMPIYDMSMSFFAAYLYGRYLLGLSTNVTWSGRRVVVH